MKRGDIYYIVNRDVSPSEGDNNSKPAGRPAIIVSNDTYLEQLDRVQVVYLTTRDVDDAPTNVDIRSMPKPCVALCGQISWVYKDLIEDLAGTCSPYELMMVDMALAISLGLSFDKPEKKEKRATTGGITQDPAAMLVPDPATVAAHVQQPVAAAPNVELLLAAKERDIYKEMYGKALDIIELLARR